jgi:DNA-binding GntR family transcriptional regulator
MSAQSCITIRQHPGIEAETKQIGQVQSVNRAKGAKISVTTRRRRRPRRPRRPPLDRVTTAYGALRDLILTHRLTPGMPIVETQIAAQFGFTRVTLRSALQRLEHEGYVAAVPLGRYRRRVVAPLTVLDMEDLFALLGALEGVAARRAAALPPNDRRRLAARLTRYTREMLRAVTLNTPNPARATVADAEFHRLLLEACGPSRVSLLLAGVQPQVGRYRRMYYARMIASTRIGYREHAAAIRAIAAGAADRAETAIEAHWRNAGARLRPVVLEMGEHGMPLRGRR